MSERDVQAQGVLREEGGGGRSFGIRGIGRLLKSQSKLRPNAWVFCFSWILLFCFSSFLETVMETVTVTKGDSHLSLSALSPSAKVTSQSAGKTEPAPKRLKLLVRVPGTDTDVEIREGGNFSIDIVRSPVPTKSIAMRHFLQQSGLRPEQGIYIGNQNNSPEDRDGEMTKVAGLKVMAVDEDQSKVTPEVERIGAGVNATEAKLKEILDQMRRGGLGPVFIGLDIDDTLLGVKTVVENGKERKVKEELIEDRRAIGETLAELIKRGVRLVFFSDNDSQLTRERIGVDLELLLRVTGDGLNETREITFFTSSMVTSFTLVLRPSGLVLGPAGLRPKEGEDFREVRYDTSYGQKYRLSPEVTNRLLQIVGEVKEILEGVVLTSGEVGRYYLERLTRLDEKGKYQLRPAIKETYPEFITGTTPGGNVKYPDIQPRDLLDDGSVSMIAVVPVVSRYSKGSRLAPGEEDERALLVRKIATAIQRLELAGGVEVSGSGERLDRVLFGTSLKDLLTKRRQDLLKIIGSDEAALTEALRQNEQANRLSLNTLVTENRVPEFDRQDRPSPLEAPEAFLITGGTSGNFFTGVLPEIITTTPPIREVRLNAIVGLAPFDDGGGSRKIMKMFARYLGLIPPPGDEVNVMAGLTSARKRWVLRYRTGKEDTGSLKQKMLQVLTMAYTGKDLSGNVIPELKDEPVDADWVSFSHHLLMLAELLDERYFMNEERVKESRSTGNPEEELTIAGNSIGNFFNVGMKIFTGAYSEETKEIDPRKYSQAIQRMLAVLGIPDIHIVPSSFDIGTLYAILEAPAIKIGNHEVVLDEEAIQKGEIKVGETVVKVARPFGALVSFTIQGETATLIEEFGSSITRDYVRNGVKVSDSVTRVIIRDRRGREAVEVLDARGQGKEVAIGGIPVRIKGRLIIEQTNITDSLHTSPIVDINLINEVVPRANPEYVELLEKTQEIVVMGPGSNATSLLPQLFSPEIVQVLVRRTQAGLPTMRVDNPFDDNETVLYTPDRITRLDEKVSKQPFEKLWNRRAVNDLVTIAKRAVDSKDSHRIQEVLHLIALMNELELKRGQLVEARTPGDFSKLAKLSRGAFGAKEDERIHLKRLLEIGGIPSDFELSDIRALKAEMAKRHVRLYLKPLATVIRREVRTAGAAKTEEGIGFDRSAFGEVLDEILLEKSQELSIYQDLLETFDNDFTILEMEIRRMMAIFPNWTRRHILEKMHQWWIDQEWPAGTPLLTEEDVHQMPMPKVIIANVAYTMLWLDGQHRPKDAPTRLVKAINKYLKRGGVLILQSGFSRNTIHERLVSKIDADLRRQIIVAPSSGAEAWGYTPSGDFNQEPFYSYTRFIDEKTRDIWYAIVQKVYREFELDQPLYSLTGDKIDDPVPMDIREAQITMESVGRTNLTAGVAERINASLRAKGLGQYQIRKVDGYYDTRLPVIQRLGDLFSQYFKNNPLPVNFVPIRIGTGAINISIVTPGVGLEQLQQNRVVEGIVGPVTQREVLVLGRRKEDLKTQLPRANFVIFQLYDPPSELPRESRLFQGPPGPLGVTKLVELLLEGPRTRSSERNELALMLSL